MAVVVAEVDIAPDGSMTVTPNPVTVPSGDNVVFHVRTNLSPAKRITAEFPGGPESPFGEEDMKVETSARPCNGPGSAVNWPQGVTSATVSLSVHGSPELGRIDVELFDVGTIVPTLDPVPMAAPVLKSPAGLPTIIHNYYFDGGSGASDKSAASDYDWDVATRREVVADTVNCYRYRITNDGPSDVIVQASPSGKSTRIPAGQAAYVECEKIEISSANRTRARGYIRTA